jgi:hypothetical protein
MMMMMAVGRYLSAPLPYGRITLRACLFNALMLAKDRLRMWWGLGFAPPSVSFQSESMGSCQQGLL